ncbi:GIY-YIG nuclease family protein [Edaphobacter albus]|uniref:GIY-YIG nuclease family protein n=1 Tax=Edaphobacter sp. 4G125 TaxID=2763071 RepID=UPI001C997553|nr:GIY-YIG nuclease family protein [Edaphobacter sp. 4G125]
MVRPEALKTGVYFLVGEEAGRSIVYVGEGDCIADRVKKHAKDVDKEFWERVCLITSKDVNLTKAHVRYLESRLVQIISNSGRAQIVNGNEPPSGSLPEADLSGMEFFLLQIQILLPTVGMEFLRAKPSISPPTIASSSNLISDTTLTPSPRVLLTLNHLSSGVAARAYYEDGEIVVLEGSTGTGSVFKVNQYAPLRQQLLDEGKLEKLPDGGIRFLADVVFRSPSAAAAVLNNRNSSGPREWRLEDGQTLGEWRDALLEGSVKI